jgi:hypothetical protein
VIKRKLCKCVCQIIIWGRRKCEGQSLCTHADKRPDKWCTLTTINGFEKRKIYCSHELPADPLRIPFPHQPGRRAWPLGCFASPYRSTARQLLFSARFRVESMRPGYPQRRWGGLGSMQPSYAPFGGLRLGFGQGTLLDGPHAFALAGLAPSTGPAARVRPKCTRGLRFGPWSSSPQDRWPSLIRSRIRSHLDTKSDGQGHPDRKNGRPKTQIAVRAGIRCGYTALNINRNNSG